jgi:hypothetical protein
VTLSFELRKKAFLAASTVMSANAFMTSTGLLVTMTFKSLPILPMDKQIPLNRSLKNLGLPIRLKIPPGRVEISPPVSPLGLTLGFWKPFEENGHRKLHPEGIQQPHYLIAKKRPIGSHSYADQWATLLSTPRCKLE